MTGNARRLLDETMNSPLIDDFSDNTLRIRRNMLAASFIAMFILCSGLNLVSFLGFKFVGLDRVELLISMLLVTAYFTIHFCLNSISDLQKHRIRATGRKMLLKNVKKAFSRPETGVGIHDDMYDIDQDPTIFSWFATHKERLTNTTKLYPGNLDVLEEGLENFGNSFCSFLAFQNLRWRVIEFYGPLSFSVLACICILLEISFGIFPAPQQLCDQL